MTVLGAPRPSLPRLLEKAHAMNAESLRARARRDDRLRAKVRGRPKRERPPRSRSAAAGRGAVGYP